MPGPSIYHWEWIRRPNATIENSLIISGNIAVHYHPGKYQKEILTAVLEINDEKTVLKFIKQWGFLGFRTSVALKDNHIVKFDGINGFVSGAFNNENEHNTVGSEILQQFFPNISHNLYQENESIPDIIHFAQKIRYLSEVKRLLSLYYEGSSVAVNDMKEWLKNLPPEWHKELVWADEKFLQDRARPGESGYYQYVLNTILHGARNTFSHSSERGVWVQLKTSLNDNDAPFSLGQPVFQFDGLFRFIEYILLIDGCPSPKKCADPKCGHLFFPTNANQEYCPPPPGVKRSRCEGRHTRWLNRHGYKKLKVKEED